MNRIAQWVLYDQCNIRTITPGVTDVIFVLNTSKTISGPVGPLKFAMRSKIAEYAIARGFLADCMQEGYAIHFVESPSYFDAIQKFLHETGISKCFVMHPAEEYLARKIQACIQKGLQISLVPNNQFLITPEEFQAKFAKPPVMEVFYRYMRTSRNILLDAYKKPVGGKWNFDAENRSFDKNHIPSWEWPPSQNEYVMMAKEYFSVSDILIDFPTTRNEAWNLLEYFVANHLHDFGRLEDAMYQEDGKVHHSYLSIAMNFGLLHPKEVIDIVLSCDVPLSSKEGFVRQVIGWREYVRQFYLFYYDDIYTKNYFNHAEKLPENWWRYDSVTKGNQCITGLNCVDTVLSRVQDTNYSHHIERLMIIGNYSLLLGYEPNSVNTWFWEMYTDAFEWVVTPNVLAMSQMSDGGRLATKPYISGGNYIHTMSDYCKKCAYSVKEKTCPMTHLYWDFVYRNKGVFEKGRTPYILKSLEKIDRAGIEKAKATFLEKLASKKGFPLGEM